MLLAVALAVAASFALSTAPAGAATYPVPYNFGAGILAATLHPGSSPPGSNDWNCRPSAAHPYPVVLVHGTFGNMTDSWQALSPLLANNGYCVFALDYGGSPGNQIQATGDIPTSATQLGAFVGRVLDATGATKVDVVGHSQGGMMPRWYIKFLGGDQTVHELVGLAPSNHGTTLASRRWRALFRGDRPRSGGCARPASNSSWARASSRSSTPAATPCPVRATRSSRPSTTRW